MLHPDPSMRKQLLTPLKRQRQRGRRFQPLFNRSQLSLSFVFTLLVITALGAISELSRYPLLIAPFGASTMLLFGDPSSPLAQPRNIVLGNTVGAAISIGLVSLFDRSFWVMGLSVALTMVVCAVARCLHPPAGGVAMLGVFLKATPLFLVFPVLVGSLFLVFAAVVVHSLLPTRARYPEHWL